MARIRSSKFPTEKRAGMALVYVTVLFSLLIAFASLAVDYGRVQLSKTELQGATDAAARYGAAALTQGVSAVQTRVAASAAENKVDGVALSIDTTADIEFGLWDSDTRVFAVLTGSDRSGATAIRVTSHRMASRNTAVPTLFTKLLGRQSIDIKAVAVAAYGNPETTTTPGDACPWLAGMPNGSTVAATGGNPTASVAPNQSPSQVNSISITPGNDIIFRQASGSTSYVGAGDYGPDGETDWIVQQAAANGINTTKAPIQSLVGIFLDDRAPNTYSQAASLDFSTSGSRDFTNLAPLVKQVFFIGDGLTSAGTLQTFTVPTGATRLYLGIMDEKGWWWDNTGTLSVTTMDGSVMLVK